MLLEAKSPRQDLVRAAALLIAEIERLDREVKAESKEGEMTAIANIGSNFVVALPPSDIWLNDSPSC